MFWVGTRTLRLPMVWYPYSTASLPSPPEQQETGSIVHLFFCPWVFRLLSRWQVQRYACYLQSSPLISQQTCQFDQLQLLLCHALSLSFLVRRRLCWTCSSRWNMLSIKTAKCIFTWLFKSFLNFLKSISLPLSLRCCEILSEAKVCQQKKSSSWGFSCTSTNFLWILESGFNALKAHRAFCNWALNSSRLRRFLCSSQLVFAIVWSFSTSCTFHKPSGELVLWNLLKCCRNLSHCLSHLSFLKHRPESIGSKIVLDIWTLVKQKV